MKKLLAFLCSILLVGIIMLSFTVFSGKLVYSRYSDNAGDILSPVKYKSMILQEKAISNRDNLLVYGSSELEKTGHPFHPSALFKNKKDGFQVDLIGKAGSVILVHDINFGALGDRLKGQKVAFIISPQWFKPSDIGYNTFHANYSEEMFYAYMFNNKLSNSLKKELAKRILDVTNTLDEAVQTNPQKAKKPVTDNIKVLNKYYKKTGDSTNAFSTVNNKIANRLTWPKPKTVEKPHSINSSTARSVSDEDLKLVRNYCKLYLKDDRISTVELAALKPYYELRYGLLKIKDNYKSIGLLAKNKNITANAIPGKYSFDWKKELSQAQKYGEKVANNNPFGIDNGIYNLQVKGNLNKFKGAYKNFSYKSSPEYDDFKLLLNICKDNGIKPLFIIVPVNGAWYDYCQFSKQDRLAFYKRAASMVKSYGFQLADFSKYEYDKYFLKDASHLGYKGWVYVDEALDKYYHE